MRPHGAVARLARLPVDVSTPTAFQIETCMQAVHDYQHIIRQLNTGSLAIIEATSA
jgi:hypothetical protein